MSDVILAGQGTILKLGAAIVGQQVSLDGPDIEVESISTTNLGTVHAKTFRPSALYDPGTLSGTLQYNPKDANHQAVLALMIPAPAAGSWTLLLTDGSTYAFSGFPTKWSLTGMEEDGNVEAEFEIKISGPITITPAA